MSKKSILAIIAAFVVMFAGGAIIGLGRVSADEAASVVAEPLAGEGSEISAVEPAPATVSENATGDGLPTTGDDEFSDQLDVEPDNAEGQVAPAPVADTVALGEHEARVVANGGLTLRMWPIDGSEILTIPDGAVVTVTSEWWCDSYGGVALTDWCGWFLVEFDGYEGSVLGEYLDGPGLTNLPLLDSEEDTHWGD